MSILLQLKYSAAFVQLGVPKGLLGLGLVRSDSTDFMKDKRVELNDQPSNNLMQTKPPSSGIMMLGWKTGVRHRTLGFSKG